jgi:hypothetical protein
MIGSYTNDWMKLHPPLASNTLTGNENEKVEIARKGKGGYSIENY